MDAKGGVVESYNLPVGAHLMIEDNEKIDIGKILVKIPRKSSKQEILQVVYLESLNSLKLETLLILLL